MTGVRREVSAQLKKMNMLAALECQRIKNAERESTVRRQGKSAADPINVDTMMVDVGEHEAPTLASENDDQSQLQPRGPPNELPHSEVPLGGPGQDQSSNPPVPDEEPDFPERRQRAYNVIRT